MPSANGNFSRPNRVTTLADPSPAKSGAEQPCHAEPLISSPPPSPLASESSRYLAAASASAQGLLVDVRPAILRSACRGRSRPTPEPRAVELQDRRARSQRQAQRPDRPRAGLADVREHGQRADGSLLHVSAAVRRRDRPVDAAGRRQGIPGQAALEGRGPAALRRDRPQESRPGPVGMGRHRHVPDERVPDSARREADRHAPLLAALPQELRPHRFHLPAEHGQVHVRAARQAQHPPGDRKQHADQERLLGHAHGEDRAAGQDARRRQVRGEEDRAGRRLPPVLRHRRRERRRRASSAIGPRRTRTATSCCSPARKSKRPTTSRSPRRSCSSSIARAA